MKWQRVWLRFWRLRDTKGRWVRPSGQTIDAVGRETLAAMLADPDRTIRDAAAGIAKKLAARGTLGEFPAHLEPRQEAGAEGRMPQPKP